MAVAKKAVAKKAAAPARKTASRNASAPAVLTTTSGLGPVEIRLNALSFARNLWGGGEDGEPVTTAAKVITQAKKYEAYLNGGVVADED